MCWCFLMDSTCLPGMLQTLVVINQAWSGASGPCHFHRGQMMNSSLLFTHKSKKPLLCVSAQSIELPQGGQPKKWSALPGSAAHCAFLMECLREVLALLISLSHTLASCSKEKGTCCSSGDSAQPMLEDCVCECVLYAAVLFKPQER